MHYFSSLFGKELYMFRTDLLSIIRSLSTVFTALQSAPNRHTVRPFTESGDTRGCGDIICPPEDEQGIARNMLRIIM